MKHIHCSPNIPCPRDLQFLYSTNYIRRAGIIPFMIHNNTTYLLMGLSKEKHPAWADLGGRAEKDETTLETALREFGEESRYVLPVDLNRLQKVIITSKTNNGIIPDQVILLVQIDPTHHSLNINDYFQQTVPKTKYEDEMRLLQWIPYNDFLAMTGLSDSMKHTQKVLRKL